MFEGNALKFGAFIAPYHWIDEHPTLCIERDLQLIEQMDQLDFDEAWVGEHHSGGYEIVSCPELLLAAAAERTKRIKLGTGVNSLTYHNPLMVANRLVQLDHQSRGRVMFGAGPGQLPSDAAMMGIDPNTQRRKMLESLECIVPLLEGKTVTRETDWFNLCEAKLHLLPYQQPRMEVVVASAITASGPTTAGNLGLGMLSVAASSPTGFNVLPEHWRIYDETAKAAGKTVLRNAWRVVAPMHLAETREQARAEVKQGVLKSVEYTCKFLGSNAGALNDIKTADEALEHWESEGLSLFGVLTAGTPADAIEYIERIYDYSGGFGTFLLLAHNCANWAATRNSYELFARHVIPHFRRMNVPRSDALDTVSESADRHFAHWKSYEEAKRVQGAE